MVDLSIPEDCEHLAEFVKSCVDTYNTSARYLKGLVCQTIKNSIIFDKYKKYIEEDVKNVYDGAALCVDDALDPGAVAQASELNLLASPLHKSSRRGVLQGVRSGGRVVLLIPHNTLDSPKALMVAGFADMPRYMITLACSRYRCKVAREVKIIRGSHGLTAMVAKN